MAIHLQFLGAARNVTGSRHLLAIDGRKVLVDCGLYQERNFRSRNWEPFPVEPKDIDAVLLTHAHLDHCGFLPRLVREGFKGRILCTAPTHEIAKIVLLDAARIQEEDAHFKKKRHEREGRKGRHPEVALYNKKDAQRTFSLFESVKYGEPVVIGRYATTTFYDAGHILGSAMIKVRFSSQRKSHTIIFSGDVGRWKKPILKDPTLLDQADYVMVESTYGDTFHEDSSGSKMRLCEVINSTVERGGNVVIPSFALERTQELLYYLSALLREDRVPHLMTFVDSPMAISVTEVFQRSQDCFDEEMLSLVRSGRLPFYFSTLRLTRSSAESKAINHIRASCIIIAGSGMCTGGRIKHHLISNISRPESTILFVGYQAHGTLGREILEGKKAVRIHGQTYPVKANVVQLSGFSAHADQDELLKWLSGFRSPPREVFVVHGEGRVPNLFAKVVEKEYGWKATAPEYLTRIALSTAV